MSAESTSAKKAQPQPLKDLKLGLALLFKNIGKSSISRRELELKISMDLRWFAPPDAKRFVAAGLKSGYLKVTEADTLTPTFSVKDVNVPLGFKPGVSVLEYAEAPVQPSREEVAEDDLLLQIIDKLADFWKCDRKTAFGRVSALQQDLNVTVEAAALLMAAKAGLEVKKFLEPVENILFSSSGT
jgi:hypothetical protein